MHNGSFLLTPNQRLIKILAYVVQSNVNAPACKVVVNRARHGLVKNLESLLLSLVLHK